MEDIDGGLHPAVDGQSLDEDEDEDDTQTHFGTLIHTPWRACACTHMHAHTHTHTHTHL